MRLRPPRAGDAPEQRRWHIDAKRLGGAIRLDASVGSISTEWGCRHHVRFTPVSDRTADIDGGSVRAANTAITVPPKRAVSVSYVSVFLVCSCGRGM